MWIFFFSYTGAEMKWMNASPNLTAVAPNGANEGSDFITPPDSVTEHGTHSAVWQAIGKLHQNLKRNKHTNKQISKTTITLACCTTSTEVSG